MKFNQSVGAKALQNHPDRTSNLAGGVAYKLDSKMELYQRVATCLVSEPKYYEGKNETTDRIIELCAEISKQDPEFILELGAYTRKVLHLRSVPVLLLGESVLNAETRKFVRRYTPNILSRADELSEIVAYLQSKMGDFGDHSKKGMLPNCIKKGIADIFPKFTEYQLSKYEKVGADKVKLRDVLRLTHPKPSSEEQSALWKRLKDGNLKIADTWETKITAKGVSKETWEENVKVMPIMALLRNLRNLLDHDVSQDSLKLVEDKLKNIEVILNSKQLPFRFLSAYKAIENHTNFYTKKLMAALEDAMDISCQNLPKLKGTTALFADISGSMDTSISKSQIQASEIACMMLAIADKICEVSGTAVFSHNVWPVNLNPRNGVLTNTKIARSTGITGGTCTYLCLERLKTKVDRVLIFTDQQDYGGELARSLSNYRREFSPNCYFYNVDLRGYGTTTIPTTDARSTMIAGWSERILEYVNLFEEDKSSILEKISGRRKS